MKVIVLGAGMVGRAIAIDLKGQHDIKVVDINQGALDRLKENFGIQTEPVDITDKESLSRVIADTDLVVDAVPGFMGYETIKTVIQCGKHIVDIAFFPEDPKPLDALARENGVIAITDMGIAPGMCNAILGYHHERMTVDTYLCLVGGLPKKRRWPWEYKAPFSPCDVIEEYVRPARYRENGVTVVRPALSDPELIDFDHCGTLEAWNSDGLRSLIQTMPEIPNMKEKTLRYPGHIEKVNILRESGFFSRKPLTIDGTEIIPLQLTEALLFTDRNWKLGKMEEEFTVMRVMIKGETAGVRKVITYDLYDEYNPDTKTSSMARTTGYACTGAVKLISDGIYRQVGLSPAECLGKDEACFQGLMAYMRQRGVRFEVSERADGELLEQR